MVIPKGLLSFYPIMPKKGRGASAARSSVFGIIGITGTTQNVRICVIGNFTFVR
jgi:hypothetical protein